MTSLVGGLTLWNIYQMNQTHEMWYAGPVVNTVVEKCENCLVQPILGVANKYAFTVEGKYGCRWVCGQCHILWWHRLETEEV